MDRIQELTEGLAAVADIAMHAPSLTDRETRLVLEFVVRVANALEQSFVVAYSLLMDLAVENNGTGHLGSSRLEEIRARVSQFAGDSPARPAPALFGQLQHLAAYFCECIEPIIQSNSALRGRHGIWRLIDPTRGEIVEATGACAREISHLIGHLDSPTEKAARSVAHRIGTSLDGELWELRAFSWQTLDQAAQPQVRDRRIH